MFLHIVPIYAAILGLMYVLLAAHVVHARWKYRVSLGAAGNADLEKRVRIHGNFAEYVPFILLLLAFTEGRGAASGWIQGLCILLVFGRVLHVIGIKRAPPNAFRAIGVMSTFFSLIGAALLILI